MEDFDGLEWIFDGYGGEIYGYGFMEDGFITVYHDYMVTFR